MLRSPSALTRHGYYLSLLGPTMLSVPRSAPTGSVPGRRSVGRIERTLAHVSGARAGGRRMARACTPQSAERARGVRVPIECVCFVVRRRHDVRRHELGGARAPRDDGQHPRRRRRHHLVHVPHQQRDPAAQVAPQTEVGGERRNASLGYFRCQRHQFLLPELSGRAALLLGLRVTRQKRRALLGLIYCLVDMISPLPVDAFCLVTRDLSDRF